MKWTKKMDFVIHTEVKLGPKPKPRLQQHVQLLPLWLPSKEVLLWFPDHSQTIRV